jgi:hypothetical protein
MRGKRMVYAQREQQYQGPAAYFPLTRDEPWGEGRGNLHGSWETAG